MANPQETLLDWLRDAHAMEDSNVSLLERQVAQLKDRPDVHGKISEHLEVTRAQRDRLKGVIEHLGGDVSMMKKLTGTILANVQAIAAGAAPDAVVKNALSNYAVENFEIACYTSLIAAAEAQGQTEVKRVCQENLEEERDMAKWLEHHIPRLTTEYLGKVETARR